MANILGFSETTNSEPNICIYILDGRWRKLGTVAKFACLDSSSVGRVSADISPPYQLPACECAKAYLPITRKNNWRRYDSLVPLENVTQWSEICAVGQAGVARSEWM